MWKERGLFHKMLKKRDHMLSSEELDALLKEAPSSDDDVEQKMELVLDFPLEISVRIGDTNMSIGEIMDLSTGMIIELNRMVDENVDLLVNGKLFAKGEVLSMGEYFGIRITSIVKPVDRVEKLRDRE